MSSRREKRGEEWWDWCCRKGKRDTFVFVLFSFQKGICIFVEKISPNH
jgi:hypothetical protein